MSAPSQLHEQRVELLGDLATLAGYDVEVFAWESVRPDVVRLHRTRPALFLADAKATEPSTDAHTRSRLRRYARVGQRWLDAGFALDLAVAHGPTTEGGWAECLRAIIEAEGLHAASLTCDDLGGSDWITTARSVISTTYE